MEPPEFFISSPKWWFKPIEMLCQNWALIEESKSNSKVTVYFFHDLGALKHTKGVKGIAPLEWRFLENRIAIIDSLDFSSIREAKLLMEYNDFEIYDKNIHEFIDPGPPKGVYFDARDYQERIYFSGKFWRMCTLEPVIQPEMHFTAVFPSIEVCHQVFGLLGNSSIQLASAAILALLHSFLRPPLRQTP